MAFFGLIIDNKLRKVLAKINSSNWCWTLFSCQGHKHKDKSMSLPYFVFIVKNEKKSELLLLLLNTLNNEINSNLPIYNPFSMEFSTGLQDDRFTIISVHWNMAYLQKAGKLKRSEEHTSELQSH